MINSLLVMMAFQFINMPYRWGGNGVPNAYGYIGYDCSGLVIKVLEDLKVIPVGYDMSAQGIYNWCNKQQAVTSEMSCDSLLFFGPSISRISHVAISLGQIDGVYMMIEAGGAGRGSDSMSEKDLLKKNARVRIMPVSNRQDLVSGIKLPWNRIIGNI